MKADIFTKFFINPVNWESAVSLIGIRKPGRVSFNTVASTPLVTLEPGPADWRITVSRSALKTPPSSPSTSRARSSISRTPCRVTGGRKAQTPACLGMGGRVSGPPDSKAQRKPGQNKSSQQSVGISASSAIKPGYSPKFGLKLLVVFLVLLSIMPRLAMASSAAKASPAAAGSGQENDATFPVFTGVPEGEVVHPGMGDSSPDGGATHPGMGGYTPPSPMGMEQEAQSIQDEVYDASMAGQEMDAGGLQGIAPLESLFPPTVCGRVVPGVGPTSQGVKVAESTGVPGMGPNAGATQGVEGGGTPGMRSTSQAPEVQPAPPAGAPHPARRGEAGRGTQLLCRKVGTLTFATGTMSVPSGRIRSLRNNLPRRRWKTG